MYIVQGHFLSPGESGAAVLIKLSGWAEAGMPCLQPRLTGLIRATPLAEECYLHSSRVPGQIG